MDSTDCLLLLLSISVFTARCYASAEAMALCPSVCLSVRPSVTSRCSTKTAKRRDHTNNTHNSPGNLVTRHPAEVTFSPLTQPKLVLDLATPHGCKAELT